MVASLQEILGITASVQTEPFLSAIAALFVLFLVAFFAEILKLIVMR